MGGETKVQLVRGGVTKAAIVIRSPTLLVFVPPLSFLLLVVVVIVYSLSVDPTLPVPRVPVAVSRLIFA